MTDPVNLASVDALTGAPDEPAIIDGRSLRLLPTPGRRKAAAHKHGGRARGDGEGLPGKGEETHIMAGADSNCTVVIGNVHWQRVIYIGDVATIW